MRLHRTDLLLFILFIGITFISCGNDDDILIKKDPIINWENPSNILYGSLLTSVQLNASSDVSGYFSYTPQLGKRLDVGNAQELSVKFFPDDTLNYNTVNNRVTIDISPSNGYNIIFNPDLTYGTVTDQDGNIYKTIEIGNQTWMAENLRTTKYRNGDPIEIVTDRFKWEKLTTGSYCWQNNDITYKNNFGALYNWYAVNDSRNIAPVGWHVPSDEEWKTLIDYLGGDNIAGAKMKENGQALWNNTNTDVTNESGFTAVPSGYRLGRFDHLGYSCSFWSSIQGDGSVAWQYVLASNIKSCNQGCYPMYYGFSIRCVKNN